MIEIFGHRGAHGYFPENTLTGFKEAVKMGVNWLELDVVISRDKKVVVSHEPWMSPRLCTMPDGKPVTNRKFNLYKMNYDEIKKFDCGKRTDKKFPKQKPIPSYKPLLSEVIELLPSHNGEGKGVGLCIEIKSFKILEGKYQPPAEEFAALVYEVIMESRLSRDPSFGGKNISDKVMVTSFDRRILRYFQKTDENIKTGLLFLNLFSVKTNLRKLGFVPYAYSPYYKLVTKKMIVHAHQAGMKVIAWTVNDEKRMKQLIGNGVDGIVTDYPDVAIKT